MMLVKRLNVRSSLSILNYSVQTVTPATNKEKYYKNLAAADPDENTNPSGWDEAKLYGDMPGPKPLPIFGNMLRFLPGGEFHNLRYEIMIKSLQEKYGNVVRFGGIFGYNEKVFLFNPEDMEHVLRTSEPFPSREALTSINYYRNTLRKDIFKEMSGLVTTQGENWYKMRTIVNPILMQPRIMEQYATRMDEIAKDLVKLMKRDLKKRQTNLTGEKFDTEIYKWALESVTRVALNRRLGVLDDNCDENSDASKLTAAVLKMFDHLYILEVLPPYWKFVRTKTLKDFVNNSDFITNTISKFIDEGSAEPVDPSVPDHELSIFQRLLKIDKHAAFVMTSDMILAGIDTTGKVLGATLYYLASNPDKQNKLREELLKYLPHKESVITDQLLSKMHFLSAVVKESTRLAPIAIGNVRTTTKNIVVGGYQIPKGIDLLTIHLHSSVMSDMYVKEPTKFVPERWIRSTNDEYSVKNTHQFAQMPFGFGTRSCIGRRIAKLELEIATANIIRNFDLSWEQPEMSFCGKLLYGFADPLIFTVKEL